MERDLNAIREEIDRLDSRLAELLCRRMDCSLEVAAYKAAHGLPVLNGAREAAVLNRVRETAAQGGRNEGYPDAAALVFSTIMDASRALQHKRLHAGGGLREALDSALHAAPADMSRIVCQGCPGAFSDEAAGLLIRAGRLPAAQPRFVSAFADVVAALEADEADFGVLPVENSSTGSVHEVYDLLMSHHVTIAAAVDVPVSHCLLALPGADPEALTAVYSHPQGLAQCAQAIAARGLEPRAFSNTAMAAAMVAEKGDPHLCAIASRRAAEIYGLEVLQENIQTVEINCTRFLVLSRRLIITPDADRVSLIFSLPHVTGSLYRALARFAAEGLNLTKIESRPMRTGGFEFAFYLDFEGTAAHAGTVDLLCALSEEMPMFTFLGNYRELDGRAL